VLVADVLVERVKALREQGAAIPAIVTSGEAGAACDLFERVATARGDVRTAMIYIAAEPPGELALQRLRNIDGVTQRLLILG
jgi:hypothetical protein